uniref:Shroom family member 2 n=2 Tax=Tetraodon nigroviridis TaxID=99883 RepID=H3DIF0_TETNG
MVEVLLRGTAPWGFTLRGGAEHREPLVITKVEEGSAAATVCLRAGDEMVSVNAVRLSGSRQEAISLVKSSHRTLTLVVRRKNDPVSRPHSWYSSKLTEEEPESAKRGATAAPVWQPQHETKPKESPKHGDQDSRQQLSSQIGSVKNMERLEPPALLYPAGHISPTEYISSAEPFCGLAGKKDAGLSCFSTGSSPPGLDSSPVGWKGTSAESMFFKGPQKECSQAAERPRYLQPPLGSGGWEGERAASRASGAVKASVGPVWQVPEKNKEQPPPPPPPPLRSDSFAVTKVFPYSEGPTKSKGRSSEKLLENGERGGFRSYQKNTPESRNSLAPLSAKDLLHPSSAAGQNQNQNQLQSNKPFSLSSTDVRQSQHSAPPAHQRQYSDESPRYLQARTAAPRMPSATNRSKPSAQGAELQARQGRAEGWSGTTDRPHRPGGRDAAYYGSFRTNGKTRYSLPQFQVPYSVKKEPSGPPHLGGGPEGDLKKPPPACQSTNHKVSPPRQAEPWSPQEDRRISPLKTPLLHSLAQEGQALSQRRPSSSPLKCAPDSSDLGAPGGGKSNRRGDRYATALRNEIQQKRAQLQKSRSAATLTCDAEDEDGEELRASKVCPSSGVSFSNTYKDHLKEAQAKVLQATSFQRRDLEPFGPEPLVAKPSAGRVRGRRRLPLAKRTHSFSEPDKMDKVGVEGEAQTGSFGERRRFFESKPAFSRPVMKCSHSASLNADCGETSKEKSPSEDTAPAADAGAAPQQASQEQQRLGTFAEYQATWNKCKKRPEGTSQGRCHSTENILDADTQETSQCIHERSRSSPSADFYTQASAFESSSAFSGREIPGLLQLDETEGKFTSCFRMCPRPGTILTASRAAAGKLKHRRHGSASTARLPYQHDGSPDAAVSASTNGGAEADSPAQATPPLGPRSLSPSAGSQDSPPTPSSHLAPETAPSSLSSSCQRVPPEADPASFQPESSTDAHQHPASSPPVGPAPPGFPPLSLTPGPDARRGAAEDREDREDRARTPSPPFGRQRLRDTAAAALLQDDSPPRLAAASASPVKPGGFERPRRKNYSSSSCLRRSTENCKLLEIGGFYCEAKSGRCRCCGRCRSVEAVVGVMRLLIWPFIMNRQNVLHHLSLGCGMTSLSGIIPFAFPNPFQIHASAVTHRRSCLPACFRREEDSASAAVVSLVPSSSYYNTSAPKAELLIKMKDMQEQLEEQESEDELDIDLASKKQELIFSLAGKLEVLREARHSLQEDVEDNEALGREVEATVQRLCQPNQLDKFRMFVGDLDKVVSLRLSLSGRLARVENALYSLEEEAPPEEKRTLTEKRKLLMRQHEDAKELKENLDRRERLVSSIMESHLDAEDLDDYRYFVKMKSALIIEQRKLEDKIKLGEEQLKCLLDSLPLEQRP